MQDTQVLQMQKDTAYLLKMLQDNHFDLESILTYRKRYLKKYREHFRSQGFIQQSHNIQMYLKMPRQNTSSEVPSSLTGFSYLKKVDLASDILAKDCSDYEKAYQISSLFRNSKILFDKLYDFFIPYIENEYIQKAIKVYLFLLEYDHIINNIKSDYEYIMEQKKLQENYPYAKFIISEYINDPDSYRIGEFFDKYGIDSDIFAFCSLTIENLDYNLYHEYIKKYNTDKNRRFNAILYTMKNIIHGIKTGYLLDGRKFDEIEFLRLVPFKNKQFAKDEFEIFKEINPKVANHRLFVERVKVFTLRFLPEDHLCMCRYLQEKKISEMSIEYFNPNIYADTSFIINNREVTQKDVDLVVNYIQNNNLPLIRRVFAILLHQYFNNEIDINCNKGTNKEKVLLIP